MAHVLKEKAIKPISRKITFPVNIIVLIVLVFYFLDWFDLQFPPPKTAEANKEAVLTFSLKGFDTPAKIRLKELPRLSPNEKFVFEGPSETRIQFVGPSRLEKEKSVVVKEGNLKTPFGKIPKGAEEILFLGPSDKEVKIFKKPLS